MARVKVGRFEDSFVVHFGTELPRVNAYTLAGTLTGLADAARAANASINPGYEVQIVVEALDDGSFKATVRTIYSGAKNLFSGESAKAIICGVIAAFIYQKTLAPDSEVIVEVGTDEVVISQGDTQIIVPRHVHDAVEQVERSPNFRKGVADAVRSVESDDAVYSIGFSEDPSSPEPEFPIPRDRFAILTENLSGPVATERELVEITDLQIVRAILERSKRMWQFVWNGVRISAPVTDQTFYQDFFEHRITVAPGDILRARLRIRQKRHPDLDIFMNDSYEVVEILKHIPRPTQAPL